MARRYDPAALGVGAYLRAERSGSGHAALGHRRAVMDAVRPNARRAAHQGRAARIRLLPPERRMTPCALVQPPVLSSPCLRREPRRRSARRATRTESPCRRSCGESSWLIAAWRARGGTRTHQKIKRIEFGRIESRAVCRMWRAESLEAPRGSGKMTAGCRFEGSAFDE